VLASPLTALVWVFAVSAGIIAVLAVSTLCLAFRHRLRRRNGDYAKILAETPSSRISHVLTVGDLLMDASLREQMQRTVVREAQASTSRVSPPVRERVPDWARNPPPWLTDPPAPVTKPRNPA
jgi:hypothetical protein